jgi:hypothetical protein
MQKALGIDSPDKTTSSSSSTLKDESKLNRSASFLDMPPPMPKKKSNEDENHQKSIQHMHQLKQQPAFNLGLDLLSKAAAELPIVSPDISGMVSPSSAIPKLDLEGDEDVSHLSVDQCADIIDACLFPSDQDHFFAGPPCKKMKL